MTVDKSSYTPPRLSLSRNSFRIIVLVALLLSFCLGFLWDILLVSPPATDYEQRFLVAAQKFSLAVGSGYLIGGFLSLMSLLRMRNIGWAWHSWILVTPMVALGAAWASTQLQGYSYNAPLTAYLVAACIGLVAMALLLVLKSYTPPQSL